MDSLRVVTYNVRHEINGGRDAWEPRYELLATILDTLDPDIIGLQEATERQLSDIQNHLSGYQWVGCGPSSGQNNPIGYRNPIELVDWQVTWLSETPHEPESTGWDAVHPRALTQTTLTAGRSTSTNITELTVFNTHFDHGGQQSRQESACLIRHRIDELPYERPIILLGDFNVPPASPVDELLTSDDFDRQLVDSWSEADTVSGPETTFTGFRHPLPGRRFDRIFITPDIEAGHVANISTTFGGDFPSDHLPVCAELRLHGEHHGSPD